MASFSRIPLLRYSSLSSTPLFTPSSSAFAVHCFSASSSSSSSSLTTQESSHSTEEPLTYQTIKRNWKPMCLYYTQGKCTMMNDSFHLEKFNHSCTVPLEEDISKTKKLRAQPVDYFLVLDLEGKVEILEFPVMMMDAKTMQVVDLFHRFVRPTKLGEKRIKQYIENKYGKTGVDRVWHDTAISFSEVIQEFETWMCGNSLWDKKLGGPLTRAAFVTCGNWDIKTKIPQQCEVCNMEVPPYFNEWINLKDIYLNFYNRTALGMKRMLTELNIPLLGCHHLGIDDTKNITRVLQQMLADGALMQITAKRKARNVDYLFKNRITTGTQM